ncbi:hypothetical protein BT93_A1725 [Corymbia citriodora subsp. variegata]|nr:hypothetical protein BT93_A1725 [Corymbia citriodora subsp. variegata]
MRTRKNGVSDHCGEVSTSLTKSNEASSPPPVVFKHFAPPLPRRHSSSSATAQTGTARKSLLEREREMAEEMAKEMAKKKAWSLKKAMAAMSSRERRPWKLPGIKWKGGKKSLSLGFQMAVVDGVVFRIVSVVEGIVLVSTLCFFYLCCGCHF